MWTWEINPILFQWHIISIRWYGIFLVLGILLSIFLAAKLFKQDNLKKELAFDLGTWLIIGGVIGARLGHALFYNPKFFLSNPIEIFLINHGGLSSHGMTLGLLISFYLFYRTKKIEWKKIIDLLVLPIPLLAAFIRIGNFFNSEIVGTPTSLPWGMKFPLFEINPLTRHPSQIYEALLALAVFAIIYLVYKKNRDKLPPLFITNIFILLYFSTRFLIEFTKEYHTLSSGLTMGQWLSIPFILWSIGWFVKNKKIKLDN